MTFSYPLIFVVLALLIGALYAGAMYYKEHKLAAAGSSGILPSFIPAFLRFAGVTLLALLLLDPVLRQRQLETEKPLLLFALDNSSSMLLGTDSLKAADFVAELERMQGAMAQDYEVRMFRFGTGMEEQLDADPAPAFDEPASDLSAALESLQSRFANRHVGAIVLASDGIYNMGNNPAYGSEGLGAPVYTIGFGDTTRRRDLRIDRTYVNRLVYLNDRFNLKVDVSAIHAQGESAPLRLELVEGSQVTLLDSRTVQLDKDPFSGSEEFVVRAAKAGLMQLRLHFGPLQGELSRSNNQVDVFVEVLDARQRILMLAHAPHPDLAAIRQVLENQGNYEVELKMAREFDGAVGGWDLVLLHQLPSSAYPLSELMAQINTQGLPSWFILGSRSDLEQFNRSQDLLRIRSAGGAVNEVQATVNKEFALFQYSEALGNGIRQFPPLFAPFGDYRPSPQARVMLNQRIGKVESGYPLLLFGESQGARRAVLAAEGLFRWRMYDFMETGKHERFEDLVGRILQYLALKGDRRQFQTFLPRNLFTEKEIISVQAELYDESYQPLNTPDAFFEVIGEDGRRYEFRFNREGTRYVLNAGSLPPGSYRYRSSTALDGNDFQVEGRFTVVPLQLEALELTANHGLLANLSSGSGGSFFAADELAALQDSLLQNPSMKPLLHESIKTRSVINLKLIFFVLLGLLSIEWFLRKWRGGY